MNRFALIAIVGSFLFAPIAAPFTKRSEARLWLPDLVSTKLSEVRITFSPDGERMLWGTIGWSGGLGGWDIYESRRTGGAWSKPAPVAFNSSANDFDPAFAPDGSGVYFFSNRAGGLGKDDLYFAAFDARTGRYAAAVNLGPDVNSAGDDWAPVVSPDGERLMFATDGRGGKGKHDLFVARRAGSSWSDPRNLDAVNSEQEDFDAAFLEDGRSIVFSRGDFEGEVHLYVARYADGALRPGERLDGSINAAAPGVWTLGPAISPHDPGALYFTSQRVEHRGRADIYRIEYSLPAP
jgi:TolB protein